MPSCPACGSEVAGTATECPGCHLAVHLFDPVREAVGVPETDPRYSREVQELLRAVDPESAEAGDAVGTGPARLSFPSRFPAPAAPGAPAPEPPGPSALDVLPALPALPGGGVPALRRQLEEYLQIARRQGHDTSDLTERVHEATSAEDAPSLEALLRELFVRIAAALSEEYESVVEQRNGLAALMPTREPDAELASARASIGTGDLAGSQRRLRQVREQLGALEEEWATVQILIAECDLMAETIRELGGDPGPALGPLEEGRRRALQGERAGAEPVLAKATLALWSVLNPRFGPEMHRVKDALLAKRAAGADVGPGVAIFRELSQHLTRRNFGATVTCYRQLREFIDPPVPGGAVPRSPEGARAPVPASMPK